MAQRTFVPQSIDLSDWSQIEPLGKALLDRPTNSPAELERWLLDVSELSVVIDEFGKRRYIDKSCHTDDAEVAKRFFQFVEEIDPKFKPLFFAIQRKYLDSPHRTVLEQRDRRYQMLTRYWRPDVELFREANVPLETQITKLVSDYDKICGEQTVQFRGKDYTLQQMAPFQEEIDRATREGAWRTVAKRRLQDRERIENIFEQILPIRTQIAKNAGMSDFRAYKWKELKRFDYSPDDSLRFADAIAEHVVPLARQMDRQRAADLGLQKLRPWDVQVDPKNRQPLRPFGDKDIDGFVAKTKAIFERLSPQLAGEFDLLRITNNLDLDSRKGKANGGYQETLHESRSPFIFMNAAGVQRDVETLLHEGGHAFHAMAVFNEPLMFLRHPPMEFCEVASMAMELFGADHLDEFYQDPAEHARARRKHLEGIIRLFPWVATIDTFQHWIYTHPGHAREDRTKEWLRIRDRFETGMVDWSGLEDVRAMWWQSQLHLFHVPFYYVEYAIAQLGALQMWLKAKEDPRRALDNYRSALRLGGTRPLPELFSAAGIRFDFSDQTLRPLMSAVREELEHLPA